MATKKTDKQPDAQENLRYEEGIERLEAMVECMEGGELTLEEALSVYEEGMRLQRRLTEILEKGQHRLQLLETQPDGEMKQVDFEVESDDVSLL